MTDNIYQAPSTGEVQSYQNGEAPPPTFKQKLFSFEGRFSRSSYWAYGYGMSVVFSFLSLIPFCIVMFLLISAEETGAQPNLPICFILGLLAFALYIPAVWVSLAGIVKRFHDRDKTGHMAWIALIPYVGGIWILVECGCLAGTPGPNNYGPDPLQR